MLVELRKDGDAMAVVMDEFGGAEGIVTIEDIIEDVVEDIQDEYDRQEKPAEWLKKLGHHDYLVSARADPAMLNRETGTEAARQWQLRHALGLPPRVCARDSQTRCDDRSRGHQVHHPARDAAGHPGSADPLVVALPALCGEGALLATLIQSSR
jgi:hypothetical protein